MKEKQRRQSNLSCLYTESLDLGLSHPEPGMLTNDCIPRSRNLVNMQGLEPILKQIRQSNKSPNLKNRSTTEFES